MFAFGEPNFQILERKLFLDFKNPYKIVVFAEPERSEGEAIPSQNLEIVKWRKGWDSNPRAPHHLLENTIFFALILFSYFKVIKQQRIQEDGGGHGSPGRPIKPLSHPSINNILKIFNVEEVKLFLLKKFAESEICSLKILKELKNQSPLL